MQVARATSTTHTLILRVLTRILKIGVKNEVFSKMLDSSYTLLGLSKKLGVRIKKLEFKTPINYNIGDKENSDTTVYVES